MKNKINKKGMNKVWWVVGGIIIILIITLIIFYIFLNININRYPNPASIYCKEMYPNQPISFGTCQYAGRDNNGNPSCEGECGYGCKCNIFIKGQLLKNETLKDLPDNRFYCNCIGDQCSRPCFFPDNKSCPKDEFFMGSCGKENSWCAKNGYESIINMSVPFKLSPIYCIVNGKQIPMTDLMKFDNIINKYL